MDLKEFDFLKYEARRPEPPIEHSDVREFVWQFLAIVTAGIGLWYMWWRWTASLNTDALWFAVPMVLAETCAYIGLLLFIHNLWSNKDFERREPPVTRADCMMNGDDTPVSVDVFIPTYSEDPELVRYSIRDAKALRRPHNLDLRIHILDDGRRATMKAVSDEEGVNYISRSNNIGFKAGNLRNAMEQTSGDFLLICDADTRVFPTFLEQTLGYFRDHDVAWVQTPQWFYDIPEGRRLPEAWSSAIGRVGAWLGRGVEFVAGPIQVGRDPFINDPKLFYDVILRRRNCVSASFCCGAGSLHRREAVMEAAMKSYSNQIVKAVGGFSNEISDPQLRADFEGMMRHQMALETELTPYKFHVSEDIYTSIVLHSDPDRNWKSVLHPEIQSKMLSPLDLQSWIVQRFKYAGGTIDIGINDNPIFQSGMAPRKKLMYAMTFWSYMAPLWNVIFLAAPIIALFTGIAPVSAYSSEFFLHLLPFLLFHEVASMVGMWGIENFQGRSLNLAFFSTNLRAIWTVVKGEKIKFPVTPKERQDGRFLHLVKPQIAVAALTAVAIVYGGIKAFMLDDNELIGMWIVNTFWGLNNIVAMSVLIRAAVWQPPAEAVDPAPVNSLTKEIVVS
jgi:cellulose synthase (UDP-forming)